LNLCILGAAAVDIGRLLPARAAVLSAEEAIISLLDFAKKIEFRFISG
jgi:hypothetical protein